MEFNSNATVKEIKEYLSESMRNGEATICPCCNRIVKLYKRPITSSMAYGLILIDKFYGKYVDEFYGQYEDINKSWFHLENFFKEMDDIPYSVRGDMPKWVYWGCLERAEDHKEDGNPDCGMYRFTKTGRKFVYREIQLRKYVEIYNKVAYGFKGPMIDIGEALRNKFNYSELMNS